MPICLSTVYTKTTILSTLSGGSSILINGLFKLFYPDHSQCLYAKPNPKNNTAGSFNYSRKVNPTIIAIPESTAAN